MEYNIVLETQFNNAFIEFSKKFKGHNIRRIEHNGNLAIGVEHPLAIKYPKEFMGFAIGLKKKFHPDDKMILRKFKAALRTYSAKLAKNEKGRTIILVDTPIDSIEYPNIYYGYEVKVGEIPTFTSIRDFVDKPNLAEILDEFKNLFQDTFSDCFITIVQGAPEIKVIGLKEDCQMRIPAYFKEYKVSYEI